MSARKLSGMKDLVDTLAEAFPGLGEATTENFPRLAFPPVGGTFETGFALFHENNANFVILAPPWIHDVDIPQPTRIAFTSVLIRGVQSVTVGAGIREPGSLDIDVSSEGSTLLHWHTESGDDHGPVLDLVRRLSELVGNPS
jgi:hypothetical protein